MELKLRRTTEMIDKHNKEIFEGDILKQTRKSNKSDYKVIRSSMSAAFVLVPTNLEMMNDSFMVLTEVFVQNEGLKVDLSIYNEKKTNRK
jgi:yopX protein